MPDWLAAGLIAFGVAAMTTPAGVSGAVFLLPVQASVLGVPNPSLTPTNLLYNIVATPGALVRYRRAGALRSPLATAILRGSLPGVVAGAVIRVELLPGADGLRAVVAAVLLPLGLFLASGAAPGDRERAPRGEQPPRWVTPLAAAVGIVGGMAGIGGGSLISPVLAAAGYSMYVVAPAALVATLLTSVAGVVSFTLLDLLEPGGTVGPDWLLGLALGTGGLAGGYVGAALQPRVPERALRRLLGLVAVLIAARYAVEVAG